MRSRTGPKKCVLQQVDTNGVVLGQKYTDYEIIIASDTILLTNLVKAKIAKGWIVVGGITMTDGPYGVTFFAQAVALVEQSPFIIHLKTKPPLLNNNSLFPG